MQRPLCDIAIVCGALQKEDLKKRLPDYLYLINNFRKIDVSRDKNFKDTYSVYFKFRGKAMWENFDKYFKFMQECKENHRGSEGDLTFDTILDGLHKKLKIVTPSFASKLLSMINHDMPVWDSEVRDELKKFGVIHKVPPHYRQKNPNISEWHKFYTEMVCGWYKGFVKSEEAKEWIALFDKQYPEARTITKVKKIDLILWQIREKSE